MNSGSDDDRTDLRDLPAEGLAHVPGSVPEETAFIPQITSSLQEEAPTYRAMLMGPMFMEPSLSADGEALKQVLDDNTKSVQLRGNWTGKDATSGVEGLTKNSGKLRGNWAVKDDSPGAVPPYYPLEKTRRTIATDNARPSEIALRISNALRIMSIAAKYNHEKAKAYLDTSDHIEMSVQLYKHTDGGTIVEVQKRSGCSIAYYQHARRILDAAEGVLIEVDGTIDSQETLEDPISRTEDGSKEDERRQEFGNTLSALDIAASLLEKDRMDANLLGMESLFLMTQPAKTSCMTALIASRVIICGREITCDELYEEVKPSALSLGIRDIILSLIRKEKLSESDELQIDNVPGLIRDKSEVIRGRSNRRSFDDEHMDTMHNLALAVLANSLDVVAEEGTRGESLQAQEWMERSDLILTLLEVLRNADNRPHDAYLSARCLGSYVQASEEARKRANDLNAISVVNRALDIGRDVHAKLERETEGVSAKLIGTVRS